MIWALLACRPAQAPPDDPPPDLRRDVIAAIGEEVVLRHYRDFQAATGGLAAEATSFCEAVDAPGLVALRDAWWNAHGPWKRAEIVRFGPAIEEPHRLQPKIDSWPANESAVEGYLAGVGGFTQDDFDGMGSATRGFPALEVLLWAPGDATLASFEADPRRCGYAAGLASDLDVLAGRMVAAWETEWNDRLIHPEAHPDDAYDTLQDVIDEWVNRMVFTVEDLRSTKLGKPVGDTSGGEPLPDTIESRYSTRSLVDARDALSGVRDTAAAGILSLVPADRAEILPKLERGQSEAEAYLGEILEPLEVAIVDDRVAIGAAQDALLTYQVLLQVDLAQALSVTLAFNDNDGD